MRLFFASVEAQTQRRGAHGGDANETHMSTAAAQVALAETNANRTPSIHRTFSMVTLSSARHVSNPEGEDIAGRRPPSGKGKVKDQRPKEQVPPARPKFNPSPLARDSPPILPTELLQLLLRDEKQHAESDNPSKHEQGHIKALNPGQEGQIDLHDAHWVPVVSHKAYFPVSVFFDVMETLVREPERNSGSILRADILEDRDVSRRTNGPNLSVGSSRGNGDDHPRCMANDGSAFDQGVDELYELFRSIRRRILPRRPYIDWSIEQSCLFYRRRCSLSQPQRNAGRARDLDGCLDEQMDHKHDEEAEAEDKSQNSSAVEGLVVYIPERDPNRCGGPPVDTSHGPSSPPQNTADRSASTSTAVSRLPQSPDEVPFYHPKVRAVAFRFIPNDASASLSTHVEDGKEETSEKVCGTLRIEFVLFPETLRSLYPGLDVDRLEASSTPAGAEGVQGPLSIPTDHRLYRTANALVQTLHRFGWGRATGYRKRVEHDVIVPRDPYQDLYLRLKARYLHLFSIWAESTDPQKHLFEDVGIAAWLMLLWKDMYADHSMGGHARRGREGGVRENEDGREEGTGEWNDWPRPPGGFVDVGCGNGLLVYILNNEGYEGYGFDLRGRKSWANFQPVADLRVCSLDPTRAPVISQRPRSASNLASDPTARSHDGNAQADGDPIFRPNSFLIGNHADELTPWIPLLAAQIPGASFINIPCCLWQLDGKFRRTKKQSAVDAEVAQLMVVPSGLEGRPGWEERRKRREAEIIQHLSRGPASTLLSTTVQSGNVAYLSYISNLHLRCGYVPEKEALRIPSTKNWAILGRKRVWEGLLVGHEEGEDSLGEEKVLRGMVDECERVVKERVEEIIAQVTSGGAWVARTPEGKAHPV